MRDLDRNMHYDRDIDDRQRDRDRYRESVREHERDLEREDRVIDGNGGRGYNRMEQQILELQSTMNRLQNENIQLRSSMQASMIGGSMGSGLPLAPSPSMGYIAPPYMSGRGLVRSKSNNLNSLSYNGFAVSQ